MMEKESTIPCKEDLHQWYFLDLTSGQVDVVEDNPLENDATSMLFLNEFETELQELAKDNPFDISVSPSQKLAIFIVRTFHRPETVSENLPPTIVNEIFLLRSNTSPFRIGVIEGEIFEIVWGSNDSRVLLRMNWQSGTPPGKAHIWDLDVSDKTLGILFPYEADDSIVPFIEALSSDGNKLLYSLLGSDSLRMLDIQQNQDFELPLSKIGWFWWRPNGNEILAVQKDDPNTMFQYQVHLFNIESKITQQITETAFSVQPYIPTPILLSPDQSQILFISEGSRNLYLFPLCY